jgi:dienelactone hydrolase
MKKMIFAILAVSMSAQAKIVTKIVDYKENGQNFEGLVAYDDAKQGKLPGVLVFSNWMGVTDETKDKAIKTAELGYVAFAPDIYGKGVRPKNGDEAGKLAGKYKGDISLLRSRAKAGLDALKAQPNVDTSKIAATGYCFGGAAALELARSGADLKGVVTFHGALATPAPQDAKNIKGKVLALHGADDPFVQPKEVAGFEKEMKDAKVKYELIKYPGAVHSFTEKSAGNDNSKGAAYNAEADKKSWEAASKFLKGVL